MPVNNVQIGVIAQNEFAKLLVIGSNGKLEVSWPMTDDDRRDAEVHIRGKFGESIGAQVKCATHEQRYRTRTTPMLQIPFTVPEGRLINDPRFWYHLSLLSLKIAGFEDPQYLVDSTKLHKHAVPRLRNGVWHMTFQANMAENSRDIWVPNRVYGVEVGRVILQALEDLEKLPRAQRPAAEFHLPPGAAAIRRRG
jgi:hypothetical protein